MSSVIGRAPARVSLAGGGTDLPAYYERHGGAVVSFTISLFAHAQASPRATGLELVSIDARKREVVPTPHAARRLRAPILAEEFLLYQKAVAAHFGFERGTLAARSDVPMGAGLASSGALAVALVAAAAAFAGEELNEAAIADHACKVEIDLLRRSCGKQDQYAAAFGGLNLIEFFRDGSVDVTPINATAETLASLESRIMLFHNGTRRTSVLPLQEQTRRSRTDPDTLDALNKLKDMAYEMREVLERGRLDRVGEMLDEAWRAKQHLNSSVGSPEVTRAYSLARSAGASGGKLAGAGMGGTLVLYCHQEHQEEVRATLAPEGWRERPMRITQEGVTVHAELTDDLVRS